MAGRWGAEPEAIDLSAAAVTLAAEVLLLANLLELLWLVPNSRWFEERFDLMSERARRPPTADALYARGLGAKAAAAPDDVGWRRRAAAARARAAAAAVRVWAHVRLHTRNSEANSAALV